MNGQIIFLVIIYLSISKLCRGKLKDNINFRLITFNRQCGMFTEQIFVQA